MSLLLFDGFEFAPALRNGMSISSGSVVPITGRDGLGKAASGSVTTGRLTVPIPPCATVIFGVGWRLSTSSLGGSDGDVIMIHGDAGATDHLTIQPAADGKLALHRGTSSGTILATSTLSVISSAGGSWNFLEVKASIADSGGTCIVKVNGVEFINYTGDTKNAGTGTNVTTLTIPCGTDTASDDLYVCDATGSAPYNDFLGDRVVRAALPAANGATNDWVGSDGNSTDNYLLVDEVPWSTADYVGSGVAGNRDLYDMAAVSGLATVDAVQVVTQAAKSDAGARSLKTVLRNSGGVILTSGSLALSTSYAAVQGPVHLTNAAGAAWTQALVNSHQFGVEVV